MNCLDKVIKLSRTECECFEAPEDFNKGQSEVYLDELEGINLNILGGAQNCEEGNIWQMMDRARLNATLAFKADLLSKLENNYVPRRPNYSGLLGQSAFTSTLNFSQTIAGQEWSFNRIIGGKIKIKRIGLAINATQVVTINIYDNDQHKTSPLGTYNISATANELTYGVLSTPLELPLWSDNVSNLKYYAVYTVSGFYPKNNKTQCVPCSGGVKHVAWINWLSVKGIKGNDTEYSSFSKSDELMGLVFDVDLNCNPQRIICSDEYPLDFETGRAMQIAYAIRFKAGALLIDTILSSPEINRYTMMDREALYGKRNHYRAKYEEWILYLSENSPVINNDCWICKPSNLLKRGTIFS